MENIKIKYSNFKKDKLLKSEIDVFYKKLIQDKKAELQELYIKVDKIKVQIERKDFIKLLLSNDNFFGIIKDILINTNNPIELLTNKDFNNIIESPSFFNYKESFEAKLCKIYSQHNYMDVVLPIEDITTIIDWNNDKISKALEIKNKINDITKEWHYLVN